jgi:hypothetical protein
MPLAYATLLGGMTTLIGSSVNLVVSAYRARVAPGGFGMFSFTPVGVGIAIVGLVFVSSVGWRLLPKRSRDSEHGELFKIDEYMTEVRVPDKSKAVGQTIVDLEEASDGTVSVLSLLRDGSRQVAPSGFQMVRPNDLLIVRGDPESLQDAIKTPYRKWASSSKQRNNRKKKSSKKINKTTKRRGQTMRRKWLKQSSFPVPESSDALHPDCAFATAMRSISLPSRVGAAQSA